MARVDASSGDLPAPAFSIEGCVGALRQNSRVVREEGLQDLVAALEAFVCADDRRYDQREYEQAVDRCFHLLRSTSRSARERRDAYRAVGLYALTFKAEVLDRLFALDDRLAGMAPSSPPDAERAVAAIDCLAAATLACANRPAEAKRVLKAISEVVREASAVPRVLAAAMSAWTVVLAAARDSCGVAPFALIPNLLGADDPAVRMAAGEALAVCIELNILPRQPEPPRWWNDKRAETRPGDRPALESRVSELAAFPEEKHARKTEHADEIGLFREIDVLLKRNKQQMEDSLKRKNNERPEEPSVVKVSSKRWAKLVQLNFLKRYIGEGFDAHFRLNLPLFRDNLGLTGATGGGDEEDDLLQAHEKKQLRKDRERQMSLAVKRDRQEKTKHYDD